MNLIKRFIFLFILLLSQTGLSQDFFDLSVTAGFGTISSNSPYITGFTSSLSAGMGKAYNVITPRVSFYYSGDFNMIIPEAGRKYYPFIKAFAVKGIYAVNVTGDIYYEQGLGLYIANDRIYSNVNEWGAGFIVSILGGADFRGSSYSGFRVGVGGEYGLTVYNRYVKYFGLFIQAQYIFSYNF